LIRTALVFLLSHVIAHGQQLDERSLQNAVQKQDWPAIERLLSKSSTGTSTNAQLNSLYTLSLLQQNKISQALVSAHRSLQLDSTRMQSWLVLAECYSRNNQRAIGLQTLTAAAKRFSDSVQVQWALGMAYVQSGRYQDAITPFEEVMFRRSDPAVMYELARCYFKTEQYTSASELHLLLTERYPNVAIYQLAAGESLLARKKTSEAVAYLDRAITLDSTRTEAYLLLTGALQESGDSARAMNVAADAARRNQQDPMAWYNLGLLRMWQQQYDSASKALKKAIALKPNYGEAYFNLAIVQEQKGFVEDAAKTFVRCALVSSYLAPDAYNSLAIMHRRNGNLTEALTAHQQAVSLRDTSSVLHISRINSCFEAEKCELAEAFISEALQRFPANPQVLYTCARCLLRIGRAEQASILISQLEKLDAKLAEQLIILMRL
jgi:tetratricopeptide (TPR) repeat protein